MPHRIGAQVARFYDQLCDPHGEEEGTPRQSLMGDSSSTSSGPSTEPSKESGRNAFELRPLQESRNGRNASEIHRPGQSMAHRLRAKLRQKTDTSLTVDPLASPSYPAPAHIRDRQAKTFTEDDLLAQISETTSYHALAAKKLKNRYREKGMPSPLAKLAANLQLLRFGWGKRREERLSQVNTSTASQQTPEQIRTEYLRRMAEIRQAKQASQDDWQQA